ncbi:uncharacterized protein An12g06420, partial [Aspergillus niger]|uniref:CCHC-type domain-containing protein n=2 Tax=Aspergillus niger TaxID=5061 RepID=A0AAJ8BQ76_ASPNG
VCRAGTSLGPMAIPAGVTEPHPTNTQETATIFSDYDFRPRIPAARKRRRRGLDGEENEPIANPEFATGGESNGRVTNQDVRQYFNSFNEALKHQTEIIETVRAEVQELKAEQQLLRTHNKELQEEIEALRAKLEAQPLNAPVNRSWAEVAAGNPQPNPARTVPRPRKEPNCVRISTAPTLDQDVDNDRFSRALPTEAANTHIRTALLNAETTKEVQVAGIGTTKTGYVIRFRDTQSAETARNSTEWLEELGNNTKVVKPRFGIVVHRVPTEDFELEGNKKQGIEKIMAENDLHDKKFRVEDIAWLKKRDMPLGKSASMGVWLDSPEAAEWIIDNGILVGQRFIGSVEPYRVEKKRCRRCQQFGHLAWSCKERVKCGHCAGHHDQRHCFPGIRPRCSDCNGEHPTGDRACQASPNPSPFQ